MMLKKTSWSLLLLIALCIMSCTDNAVFDEYKSLNNAWNKDEVISFKVNPNDTLNPYNLFVNIRNTNDYKFNNLYLIVEMDFPNGKVIKDTLEYRMAYPNGELMGEGLTALKTNKLWYKEAVKFMEDGEYTVKISHAMRQNGEVNGVVNLEGVSDVGFRIEKVTE